MPADAPALEHWRRLALELPWAWGGPVAAGLLRGAAEDFRVEELLGFEPDGGPAHRLVLVEKIDANTLHVARGLAARIGCPTADIGFAGLKDRHAVARQWFSVPARSASASLEGFEGFEGFEGTGFRVLAVHAHSRKLRRGALAGNRFEIQIRNFSGDAARLDERAARIRAQGVPNYFGEQRFGRGGSNLARVLDWITHDRLPRGREPRAFVYSAARAVCFNAVAGARVAGASWNRLLPGEAVNLAGNRSVFVAHEIDALLDRRAADGDLSPTGPLCGSGGLAPAGEAAAVEAEALAAVRPVAERLARAGLRAERRPLVLRPRGIELGMASGLLTVSFELPGGAFATAVLREMVNASAPEPGESRAQSSRT